MSPEEAAFAMQSLFGVYVLILKAAGRPSLGRFMFREKTPYRSGSMACKYPKYYDQVQIWAIRTDFAIFVYLQK
ncbi:hypothetical protein Q4E93_13085 [Flavitalea sp. BT771]|uniref:hypothetical protein n=1 Tax=Flavitalea sp. BT771 TaxID=3063329 RepID=UPI0026E271A4|nr:hypothetical protein [Flavitalea sp. BT771]MDO6431532.1 hypothetical protein [Flavitalea sp. BT771]MDV6220440.1 hypothetical protein [Flavitalea sp. BT771]